MLSEAKHLGGGWNQRLFLCLAQILLFPACLPNGFQHRGAFHHKYGLAFL
jgi:hypothetical protein